MLQSDDVCGVYRLTDHGTFLGCHQNAFDWFGAVPGKVMVDNLKSAVLKRIVGKDPIFNPKYLDFANHHGFTIVPCAVGKGNEKGRVESGVGYVKKNFLAGLDIPDFMRSTRRSFTGLTLWQTFGFTAKPVKGLWTGSNGNGNP